MLLDYTTNAACPMRPSWQISEVGYEWAKNVFHGKRKKVKKDGSLTKKVRYEDFEITNKQNNLKGNNSVIFVSAIFFSTSRV